MLFLLCFVNLFQSFIPDDDKKNKFYKNQKTIMSNLNRISVVIPPEVAEQVKQLYAQANEILRPYLVSLTNDQKSILPKMGEKSIPFVIKAAEYLAIPATPAPPYIDATELQIDINAYETLRQIRQVASPTLEMLDDTMFLCGSETYVAVLAFYNYLKGASKMNVQGAKTIYDDLSTRFPGRTVKKPE